MKLNKVYITAVFTAVTFTAVLASSVSAATFNRNNIIDDGVFDSQNMSAGQVDSFLNGFSNSCISPNSGFRAIDPIGYNPSAGYLYGGYVTAGQVIYDAGQAYGISPQVLLTTLEKEQSLVTGRNNFSGYCNNGDQHKYAAAVGYGCPDSGTTYSYTNVNLYQRNGVTVTSTGTTCVNSAIKAGFSEQVIRAAWLLKFGEQRAEGNIGWAVIKGNWNNSDDPQTCYGGPMTQGTFQRCPSGGSAYYDGYTTIDSTATHMDDGATAALYWYTPHFSGNTSFFNLFNGWFGSTYGNYHASYYSESSSPTVTQGQSANISLSYTNDGTAPWYDSAEAGSKLQAPVVLATMNPVNRGSAFSDSSWASSSRPTTAFTKVYQSDGVTLASDQHAAQPGQIVEYDFKLNVSADQAAGSYWEYFAPIREGSPYWYMAADNVFMPITVKNAYTASYVAQSPYPTIYQNGTTTGYFRFQNNGSAAWYDSSEASGHGQQPITLATDWPINRGSDFNAGWYTGSRPDATFSKVYQSDGTTLASDQHAAQPGQIVEFDFPLTAHETLATGSYREYFSLIREGAADYHIDNATAYLNVQVSAKHTVASYVAQSTYPTLNRGGSTSVFERAANNGNSPWYDSTSAPAGILPIHLATSWPINRASTFSPTWPSASRPAINFSKVYESDGITLAANQHIVQPGQIVEFDFTLSVPSNLASGTYYEYFQPILEGASNYTWDIGDTSWLKVVVQ